MKPLYFIFQDVSGNDLLKELGLEFDERGVSVIDWQLGIGVSG
jgi:hypothetical protein